MSLAMDSEFRGDYLHLGLLLKMKIKEDMKRQVVVFDFDGTLTTCDTFGKFICFALGRWRYYSGLLACFPLLVGYVLKIVPNYRAKEQLFGHFFRNTRYEVFVQLGKDFANNIEPLMRIDTLSRLKRHIADGAKIYVVSASIEEWVRPIVERYGNVTVLATQVEVNNGVLTGHFLSKNCYGKEKIHRLLEIEPKREEYHLTAYGDSRGDKEMILQADCGIWIK